MAQKTITMQLDLPVHAVEILDELVHERMNTSDRQPMSLAEWNATPNGKEFLREMMVSPTYRALSAKELQQEHFRRYRADVPVPTGRPRLRELRAAIISSAIEQYQKIRLIKEAA